MKKKTLLLCIVLCTLVCSVFAEDNTTVKQVNKKVDRLENVISTQKRIIEQLKHEDAVLRRKFDAQQTIIDSISKELTNISAVVDSKSKELNKNIEDNKQNLNVIGQDLMGKTYWGLGLLLLLAVVSAVVYWLLNKRTQNNTDSVTALKDKTEKLNEEILNQFSLEMTEIQKLTSTLGTIAISSSSTSGEQDHSLIKTLADRITFMEMTLYKMDSKIRGHKQLSKSITQMKDNLLANGYEIVSMLGKQYNDGMKVTANFVEDEELESGQQIITGIIKPQINYKGTMIQAAQITVSQNI